MDKSPTWVTSILANIDIMIICRYNPDGVDDFNRSCAIGIDLNRDHMKLQASESANLKRLFCSFEPHVAVDMHEYSAVSRFRQYTHGSDIMFSAAKNLNIHRDIRILSEDLFTRQIERRMKGIGLRWSPYVPTNGRAISFNEAGSDAKIGRNAMGLTQCISFLCEVRGIGIADQHFQRRTAAAMLFLESLLETAAQNHAHIQEVLGRAVDDVIHGKAPIVLADVGTVLERTFPMIDVRDGQLVGLPVNFRSSTPLTATLLRSRPEGYLIPASMSYISQRLVSLGLEIGQTRQQTKYEVEVLTIVTATLDRTYFEGIVPMHVTTSSSRKVVSMPAGTYVLNSRQKNAALAFLALEPEYIDSYVSTNLITVAIGDEYPIYRIMQPWSL